MGLHGARLPSRGRRFRARLKRLRRRLLVGSGRGGRLLRLLERADVGRDLLIALADELLVVRVGAPCVAQGEQMFASPISLQSLDQGGAAGFDPRIGQFRQASRVALSIQDGVGNGQATESGQIGDGVVQMDVLIWSNAFCMCSTLREAVLTKLSRWRKKERTAHTSYGRDSPLMTGLLPFAEHSCGEHWTTSTSPP